MPVKIDFDFCWRRCAGLISVMVDPLYGRCWCVHLFPMPAYWIFGIATEAYVAADLRYYGLGPLLLVVSGPANAH